jgi:hypothetical protein
VAACRRCRSHHAGGQLDETLRADALIDRVCGTEWVSPEERYAAQRLVIRLERLKWRSVGQSPTTKPSLLTPKAAG